MRFAYDSLDVCVSFARLPVLYQFDMNLHSIMPAMPAVTDKFLQESHQGMPQL